MTDQDQTQDENGGIDAFAAVVIVTIFVITAVFWVSGQ